MKCKIVVPLMIVFMLFSCSNGNSRQVFVRGGSFTMGDGIIHAEYPAEVGDFFMDKTEVTNRQFAEVYNWALENDQLVIVPYDGSGSLGTTTFFQSGSRVIDTDHLIFLREDYPWPLFDEWKKNCAVKYSNGRFEVVPGLEEYPMVEVSWYGAAAYCNFLSLKEGLSPVYETAFWDSDDTADGYRLPTNEQWEFAARGGLKGDGLPYAGSADKNEVAWSGTNAGGSLHPAGELEPNELGLYDMNGNAWEFCTEKAGVFKGDINNSGLYTSYRLWRGGSFLTDDLSVHTFVQHIDYPGYNYGSSEVGFRCVRLK